jgi:hypothetical protein
MGAPGPYDFAVRVIRRSSVGANTSTAFRSTFVTTRTSLVSKRDVQRYTENQNFWKAEYFRA